MCVCVCVCVCEGCESCMPMVLEAQISHSDDNQDENTWLVQW